MIMRKVFRNILIGAACLAVPAAVVGGYFGMSAANPYYKFYRTPITGDAQGFISAYLSAQYLGAKAIVAPGFTHKTPIESLYSSKNASKAKDLGFVLLDEAVEYQTVKGKDGKLLLSPAIANTASITFRADLGSIQTGVAVAQFLNDNVDVFGDNGLSFGMYGGLPFSSVTSFMGGMQKGIEWFNKNLVGKSNTKTGKEYQKVNILEPNLPDNFNFSGGFGPGDGDTIINTYLQQPDIDVFMPIAGPQLWTAQKKIIELNKKTVLIGVDAVCEDDSLNLPLNFTKPDGKTPIGNGKYVQFSSIKDLKTATNNILSIMNNGNKVSEEMKKNKSYQNFYDTKTDVGGLGTIAVGNAVNGCVGVSDTGQPFLDKALKAATSDDPSLDQEYSKKENMIYTFADQKYDYSDLRQEFKNVLVKGTYSVDSGDVQALNLCVDNKPFIKKDDQADDNLIKLVLSDPTSILFDGSFAESAYNGIIEFYKNNGIKIPNRKEGK